MKYFCFVGILVLGVTLCQARSSSEELQSVFTDEDEKQIKEIVKEVIKEKCEEQGSKVTVDKIMKAFDSATKCLGDSLPKNKQELRNIIDNDSSEDICDKKISFKKCFEDLIEIMKGCSDEKEKYVPDFLFDAFDGVLEYVCTNNGAVISKLFEDSTTGCIDSLTRDDVIDACSEKFSRAKEEVAGDKVVTKEELCEFLEEAKTCYSEFLTKQCPKDKNLKDILGGIYKAITGPCRKTK